MKPNKNGRIIFFFPFFKKPKKGGERYFDEIIRYTMKNSKYAWVYDENNMPEIFRKIIPIHNLWYLLKFSYLDRCLLVFDSSMHARLFLLISYTKFKRKKIKLVCTVHHIRYTLRKKFILRMIEKFTEINFINFSDRVIANSYNTKDLLVKHQIDSSKIRVIPPGIDSYRIKLPKSKKSSQNDRIILFTLGTCTERKGLEYLLGAMALLPKNIVLNVVGAFDEKGEYFRSLYKIIDKYHLKERIKFYGWVDKKDLVRFYKSADIFVSSSLWEGFGIAIAEAMHFGLPIVSTKVGAIPDIVHHSKNGILVKPKDIYSLANAISMLSKNQSLREKMGRRGSLYSKQFSNWESVARKVYEEIKELRTSSFRQEQ